MTVDEFFCNAESVTVDCLLIRPNPESRELSKDSILIDVENLGHSDHFWLIGRFVLDFYPGHAASLPQKSRRPRRMQKGCETEARALGAADYENMWSRFRISQIEQIPDRCQYEKSPLRAGSSLNARGLGRPIV